MPTVFSHSLVAIVSGKIFSKRTGIKFWVLSIICAILFDIDGFMYYFGVPYARHMLGHRGVFHSLLFASVTAFSMVIIGFREIKHLSKEWWSFIAYFFLIGLSHGILDAMTSGGLGVGFFIPFDSTRYFLPWRPIKVSPFRIISFFETDGVRILVGELVWIWIPSVVTLIILWFVRKRKIIRKARFDQNNGKIGEIKKQHSEDSNSLKYIYNPSIR